MGVVVAMTAAPQQEAPKRRTLHAIVDELLAAIDDAGGEVTAAVDGLGLELEDKVEAYRAVMFQLEQESSAFDGLAHAYKQKSAARDNQITALKFRLEQALDAAGIQKLKTRTCAAYFQNTSSVFVESEQKFLDSAEDRFVVVKQYVNKTAVKEALEAGEAVDGAELRTKRHLRFR